MQYGRLSGTIVVMVEKVTSDSLPDFLDGDKHVIIDFWAPWCGPCSVMKPQFESFGKKHSMHFKTGTVNIDDYPEIAQIFNIFSIPTIVVFKDGTPVKTLTGARGESQLERELKEYMS